ncbi:MAG: hypothetical protein AB7G25_09115 [Sphingomonadaceae bacterium]
MIRQADKRLSALEDQSRKNAGRLDWDALTDGELEQSAAILKRHGGKFDADIATDDECDFLLEILRKAKHEA